MPPTTAPSLVLYNDVTTLTLTDGTNYSLTRNGWAPAITKRKRSTLAGYGPYEDVTEEISINVRGTTAAGCITNLAALSAMLDQAERWSRGEPVNRVVVKYQPQGSNLAAALSATVLGRDGEDSPISVPPTFNENVMLFEIPDVVLRFRRRGLWLGSLDQPAAVGPTDVHVVQSVTFPTTQTRVCPMFLAFSLSGTDGTDQWVNIPVMVFAASSTSELNLLEAEGLTEVGWTAVDDAARYASGAGTDVLRYTPTDATWKNTAEAALTMVAGTRRVALFAVVRNNSTTLSFQLKARVTGSGGQYCWTPAVPIPPTLYMGGATPFIVNLGTTYLNGTPATVCLSAMASDFTGPPTLDVDCIVALAADNEWCRAISLPLCRIANSLNINGYYQNVGQNPRVYARKTTGTVDYPVSYLGDIELLSIGDKAVVLFLAVDSMLNWRLERATAIEEVTVTAERQLAYLVPE